MLVASVSAFAQSTCDTTPDPGQIVGRCDTIERSEGDWAVCHKDIAEGSICFYGASVE